MYRAENLSDEELHELWEERAAVRQYDGELSKEFAEYLAARDIRKLAGRIPKSVLLKVMQEGPVKAMIKTNDNEGET